MSQQIADRAGGGAFTLHAVREFGRVGRWRAGLFVLSLATTLAVLLGRVDQLGQDGLLSAHIVQHIALADIAAPLLVLSIPPHQRRAVLATRTGAFIGRPAVALAVWAGLIYAWLIPVAHRAAVPGGAWHEADHLTSSPPAF